MPKICFHKITIVLIVIVFCLFFLEFGLRIQGVVPSNIAEGELQRFHDSYKLRKNFNKVIQFPSFSYTIYTNSFGFRDNRIGERNVYNRRYMVFLGDSMTFGNGVDYKDSFVGIFHNLALKNHGIEVLNMALGGHVFHDQAELFVDFTEKVSQKPSYAFVCTNELLMDRFEKTHKKDFIKDGYLFDKKKWGFAYLKIVLSNRSSAYFTLRNDFRQFQMQYLKFKTKRPKLYLEVYSKKNHMHNADVVKRYTAQLDRFEKYCRGIHIIPVYLYIPTASSFDLRKILREYGECPEDYDAGYYEKLMQKYALEKKRKFISLTSVLMEQYDQGKPLRFKADGHFNKLANQVIGEYIYQKFFDDMDVASLHGKIEENPK